MIAALWAFAGVYLAVLMGKAVLAARYARAHPAPKARADFSDVTILQPILGGDPRLADTLAANLVALPAARFVWLLDEDDAAGWAAAKQSMTSNVDLRSCPAPPANVNPKLFKLALAESSVTTPFLVVLDDDTQLSAVGLTALLDALATHDVATGLPYYMRGDNAPSQLLTQFVNNQSVLTYLPLLCWHPPLTLNGMAYAVRTARWRELGGFGPLMARLTDDLAVATRVRTAGGEIFQSAVPHAVGTSVTDLRHYWRVMHRWFVFALLLVRAQPRRWQLVILMLHGVPPLLLWAVFSTALWLSTWAGLGIVAALLVMRSVILAGVHRRHFGCTAHAPVFSLVAEMLQLVHLLHALVSRRVHWRSRVIDVRSDDNFSRV